MPIHTSVSRRHFLKKTFYFAGACFSIQEVKAASSEEGYSRLSLFADIHISQDPTRELRKVNMAKNLENAVAQVKSSLSERPSQGLCILGDLAVGAGFQEDYREIQRLLAPIEAVQLPVHLLMGNHDNRENCNAVFGKYQALGVELKPQIASKLVLPEVNVFLLDSLIKSNYTPGEIGAAQLAWLEKELSAESSKPAVVMVHHNLRFDDNKNALTDTEALFALSQKYPQLKAFFYGHSHTWELQEKDGKHLINLPPVSYVFKDGLPSGWVDAAFYADRVELILRTVPIDHELNQTKKVLTWN